MKRKIFFIVVFLASFLTSSSVFASSVNITQLNFTSSPQSVNVNTVSSIITVQTQNSTKGSEQTDETNYLDLSSTSSTGEFSSSNSTWKPVNKLTMSIHSANRNFYYRDSTPGIYTLTVSAEGQNWISTTQSITIVDNSIPADTTSPIISLIGDSTVNLSVGDTYSDAGATALDNGVTDLTTSIIKGGTYINTSTAGTYTITYDVSDSAGNPATQVTRTITVNEVSTPSSILSIDTSVDVPATCEVSDIDNVTHTYTANSTTSYLGICALKAALDLNSISSVKLSNEYPSMGLFVTTFNNTEADPVSQYWALYQNSGYTDFGISTLPISSGDVISFKLSDFSGSETNDTVIIRVRSLINDSIDTTIPVITPVISHSNGGSSITHHKVDIDKALRYLSEKQNSDGAFSSSMYTDWVAIAATAGDDSSLKSSLLNYIKANPLNSSSITDNERHAMALMSLGINPYSGTEINYIQKIVDAFDGTQFGDPDEFNDDIFAIFPLIKAGYDINDEMIQKDISFILSKQESDGGWGGVDLTATTIQALSLLPSSEVITQAKIEAEQYLKNSQQADGGFGNSFATSWTLQAISALGEDSSTWTKNDLNPNDYLYSLQQNDGGIEPLTSDENVRIWATYDVVPAVLGKSWGDIMQSFSKTEKEEDNSPRSGLGGTSSSNSLAEKEEKDIIQNDLVEVGQINKVVLPEIKKVSNPKVVVKDTTPEKKTVDIPEPSNNVDLDNNLLASAGSVNLGNFFKDKVIIMTIILTLVIFIGGWFVIKS